MTIYVFVSEHEILLINLQNALCAAIWHVSLTYIGMKDKNREIARLRRNTYARLMKPPKATRPKPDTCECCGEISSLKSLGRDHDHKTGAFRGWLCNACNSGIGFFQDNPRLMRRAADYITAHLLYPR